MKKFIPVFVSVMIILFNMLSVQASDNVLRGVNVVKNENSYTIVLTSKYPAKITKTIVSSNRVLLNLKDIDISSNLTTDFKGNPAIDTVMVEPCGNENANVMIQGENIAYSDVIFKELNSFEKTEDTVKSSFGSFMSCFSGSTKKDKSVQFGILGFFLIILFGEIRFIKSKYDDLKREKEEMYKNINTTKDFQDYLPGYGRAGLKKPYTTPLYGNPKQTSTIRANYLAHIKTPETVTLNSLLHNNNKEIKIIDNIVHKKPVFGSLSNININDLLNNKPSETVTTRIVSNPIQKARLKENLKHLEDLTAMYKYQAKKEVQNRVPQKRLNKIY